MKNNRDWDSYELYLNPIPGAKPTGEDLRYDPIYDQIREARRQEDESLPQGVWKRELKVAEWDLVEDLCTQALQTKTKDLQIAAWLMESWFQQKGIVGLYHGAKLMHAMSEKYWDSLYPQLEEDDAEYRLAPIDWINEKLPGKIVLHSISFPQDEQLRNFTLSEYDFLHQDTHSKASVAEHPHITLDNLKASITKTEDYVYEVLYKDSIEAIEAFECFENYLTEMLPKNRISMYQLRSTLCRYRDVCLMVLSERGLLKPKSLKKLNESLNEDSPNMQEAQMKPSKDSAQLTEEWSDTELKSREQAYALLAEIATYLEVIEPHSPTPYLLKKAISWGNMPLSQLLQEYIENNMDFAQLQRWLGIPKPASIGTTKNVASNE